MSVRGAPPRVWVAALAVACAVSRPPAYTAHRAAADRAYTAGRMAEASRAFERAAAATPRARDRDEALFLAAGARERAGDAAGALALYDRVAAASPRWERGPRAALEAARLRLATGDRDGARRGFEALARTQLTAHPGRRALTLLLGLLDQDDPTGARTLALLDALAAQHASASDVLDVVLWERARWLEGRARRADAVAAYERLLTAVPYPHNRHWDDGGVALARLLVADGDPRRAVAVLDRMLAVREPSTMNGSYEAPRFGEGALLRARILRDALGEGSAAADALHFVYASFPVSRLRDDALWEEAALREALGQRDAACGLYARLAREFPCTRFGRRGRERMAACGEAPPPQPASRRACEDDG